MKPRTIAASVWIAVGLTLAVAAWRAALVAQRAAPSFEAQPPRAARMPRPQAGLLPWFGASTRPLPAPLSLPLAPPPMPQPPLTLARGDTPAVPEARAAEDSVTDDSQPTIGEPAEEETYLEARDRAAAHSTRSR
jgi:hypothetical protein